jgi:predicted acylesterase/phospholipase RssA
MNNEKVYMDYDTVVISGGGVKGLYLLGGYQAALDIGLLNNVKKFIGTSIGAVLCYLIAIGYSPIEIVVNLQTHKLMEKIQQFNLIAMINGNGAISFSTIYESLEKLSINKVGKILTLGKLKEEFGKTLICVTYNMTKGEPEYLGPDNYPDLPCITALRMSCNIPLIFDRFKYMNSFYIDGGICDNFPIGKAKETGNKIFGLYLEIYNSALKDEPEEGFFSYFMKLSHIPISQITRNQLSLSKDENCTIINIPVDDVKNFVNFDIKSKERLDMFSKGYTAAKNQLR